MTGYLPYNSIQDHDVLDAVREMELGAMILESTSAAGSVCWDPLPLVERRVLGVLVEKQKTSKSSDSYPLSLNALTTGCNQKSNRDPVMDLNEFEVEDALTALQKKGLVTRITGGRVERFRHELYDRWTSNGPQLAVLAELLLRGPQTKGELRGRAARMDPIDSLEQLDDILKPLVERKLVVWLTEPDRRGAMITHGFHTTEEWPALKAHAATVPVSTPHSPVVLSASAARSVSSNPSEQIDAQLSELRGAIANIHASLHTLETRVDELRRQLGLTES